MNVFSGKMFYVQSNFLIPACVALHIMTLVLWCLPVLMIGFLPRLPPDRNTMMFETERGL